MFGYGQKRKGELDQVGSLFYTNDCDMLTDLIQQHLVQIDDQNLRKLLLEVMFAIMEFEGFDHTKTRCYEDIEDVLEVVEEEENS